MTLAHLGRNTGSDVTSRQGWYNTVHSLARPLLLIAHIYADTNLVISVLSRLFPGLLKGIGHMSLWIHTLGLNGC